ncbi:MAG: hypothetical protein HY892_04690 [Deltaproteobacteria bacterium]|nr:hypothetical protein [Deltaproteobacteria bacterium]
MWNFRVVRKRYVDPDTERVSYTYAIHEAYYDNNGHVGAVTQDSIAPFGENMEELRHSWVMMAAAFGLPIVDFESIPEPGYERKEDPVASVLDKRIKEMETGEVEGIPFEQVKQDLEERFGPFDEEEYESQVEAERVEKEKIHIELFAGTAPLEKLVRRICADYLEYLERDRTENPLKYKENAEPSTTPDRQ